MKISLIKFTRMTLCFIAISLMTIGCAGTQAASTPEYPSVAECTLPSGHLVAEAFVTARNTLSEPSCRYKFDAVFSALLQVAKGDPSMNHKKTFSDFLVWTRDEGIISTLQAKEYYNTYFSHIFVSLPDNYRTCNYCPELTSLISECKDELRQKELGLLRICSDKTAYTKAWNDFQDIELIMEATCSACAAD